LLREDIKQLNVAWDHASCLVFVRKLSESETTSLMHRDYMWTCPAWMLVIIDWHQH